MNKDKLLNELVGILESEFGLYNMNISESSYLYYDLGFDECILLEFALNCETHYKISITDLELIKCITFGDFVDLVFSKLGNMNQID